jgi:glycosyltransferase involved in cell wall biosynthesis
MACNLPIVATDVGDVRQVIGKTKGCYVCEPVPVEFAARLSEILSLRQRTTGRADIRHFGSSVVSEKVIEVYENVLSKRENRLAGRTQPDRFAPAR